MFYEILLQLYNGMFIADVKQNLKKETQQTTKRKNNFKEKNLTCRKQNHIVEIVLLKNQLCSRVVFSQVS